MSKIQNQDFQSVRNGFGNRENNTNRPGFYVSFLPSRPPLVIKNRISEKVEKKGLFTALAIARPKNVNFEQISSVFVMKSDLFYVKKETFLLLGPSLRTF